MQHHSDSSEDDSFVPPLASESDDSTSSDEEPTAHRGADPRAPRHNYARRGEPTPAVLVDRNMFLLSVLVVLVVLIGSFWLQHQLISQQVSSNSVDVARIVARLDVLEEAVKFHGEYFSVLRKGIQDVDTRVDMITGTLSAGGKPSHQHQKAPPPRQQVRILLIFEKTVERAFFEWLKANISKDHSDVDMHLVSPQEILEAAENSQELDIFPETDLVFQVHRVVSPKIDGFWNTSLWRVLDRSSDQRAIFISLRNVGELYDGATVSPPEITSDRKLEFRGRNQQYHANEHNKEALERVLHLLAERKSHFSAAAA